MFIRYDERVKATIISSNFDWNIRTTLEEEHDVLLVDAVMVAALIDQMPVVEGEVQRVINEFLEKGLVVGVQVLTEHLPRFATSDVGLDNRDDQLMEVAEVFHIVECSSIEVLVLRVLFVIIVFTTHSPFSLQLLNNIIVSVEGEERCVHFIVFQEKFFKVVHVFLNKNAELLEESYLLCLEDVSVFDLHIVVNIKLLRMIVSEFFVYFGEFVVVHRD